jgi:hypothetical protein
MSKPTKEEMLWFLNSLTARWDGMIPSEMELYKAIRQLIERDKSEITKEFVRGWVERIHYYYYTGEMEKATKDFIQALKEAGVEVSDE